MTLEILLGVAIAGVAALLLLKLDVQREAGDPHPLLPPLDLSVAAPAETLNRAFEAAAAHVQPAVVGIFWEKATRFRQRRSPLPFEGILSGQFHPPQQRPAVLQQQPLSRSGRTPELGMGSGVIIDKEGHILTNYRLVCDADDLLITLADHRTFAAEVIGGDPEADIAVIQIKGKIPADLPVAELGDSDNLKVGELVIAVGALFGRAQTVTSGIISATGRSLSGTGRDKSFLQTDAAINPGNSGGPLVNLRGQVVGLNTAIVAPENWLSGEGFAVPINLVRTVLPVIIKSAKTPRQNTGLEGQAGTVGEGNYL